MTGAVVLASCQRQASHPAPHRPGPDNGWDALPSPSPTPSYHWYSFGRRSYGFGDWFTGWFSGSGDHTHGTSSALSAGRESASGTSRGGFGSHGSGGAHGGASS